MAEWQIEKRNENTDFDGGYTCYGDALLKKVVESHLKIQ